MVLENVEQTAPIPIKLGRIATTPPLQTNVSAVMTVVVLNILLLLFLVVPTAWADKGPHTGVAEIARQEEREADGADAHMGGAA